MPHTQIERIFRATSCAHAFVQLLVVFLFFLMLPRELIAQVTPELCGPIGASASDYRLPKSGYVNQVEGAHFPPHVELWIRGNRGPLGSDIDYTILRIPNHHRALISIAHRAVEQKKDQLPNMTYPVECYFERGIRFRADDHIVRMLYAQFLIDKARTADAGKQLELVAKMVSNNGFATYNIGLLYSDMKDYGQALAYAHKAMALGFDRPELRQRLESVGRWTEPTAESGGLPASAASAPAPVSAASAPATQTD